MNPHSKIALVALVLATAAVGCAAPPALDDVDETSGAATAGDGTSTSSTKDACEATQLALPASLDRLRADERTADAKVCLERGRARIDVTNAAKTAHDGVLMVTLTVPRNDPDNVASSARLRVVTKGNTETKTLRSMSYTAGSGGLGIGDEPPPLTPRSRSSP